MKKLILIAAIALMSAPAFAQQMQMNRHEVSVSYGVAATTNWMDGFNDFWVDLFTNSSSDIKGWGAVTAGYNFRLTKNFSIGAQAVYSTNTTEFKKSDLQVTNRYWSLMPNAKLNWLNLRILAFYSRIGAGVSFAKTTNNADKPADSATQFAFQFSPIGVEVGGRLAVYAEAGIGVSGSVLAGVRYRF